jgi:hypothetical protein
MAHSEVDILWGRYMGIVAVVAFVVYWGLQKFWNIRNNEGMPKLYLGEQEVFPTFFAGGSVHEG